MSGRLSRANRLLLWGALGALMAAGCTGGEAASPEDGCAGLQVVATTSVLGDIVRNVGGDATRVEVLIPPGADPHSFAPSASQAAALRRADLVVANGLGLEEGLHGVIEAAAADGVVVVEAGSFVEALPFADEPVEDGDEHGNLDPHIWTDPRRMVAVASGLGGALAAADPACAAAYRAGAEAYGRDLVALDAEVEAIVAAVPPDQRKLVTSHHAFGYFADRYGFEVVGVIIPGGATLAAPSPADLAGLVEAMRAAGVRAVFAEITQPADLANALAAELGEGVQVVSLFTGSLGEPGSGAETYLAMQRLNAQRIAAALAP